MEKIKSKYHWTNYNSAKKILKSQYFQVSYCLENEHTHKTRGFYVPMVCFTEINVDDAEKHRQIYTGEVGICLNENWVINNNLQEVKYIKENEEKERIHQEILRLTNQFYLSKNIRFMSDVRDKTVYNKFIPSFCGKEKRMKTDFYCEKEWRYTPPFESLMSIESNQLLLPEYDKMKGHYSSKVSKRMKQQKLLTFNWSDIQHIVVTEDIQKKELSYTFPEILKNKIVIQVVPYQIT